MVEHIVRFRWVWITLLLICSILSIPFVLQAVIPNNSLSIWFVEDDPLAKEYKKFQANFGNDEIMVIGYIDSSGIIEPNHLENIALLSESLEQINGISAVVSITNVKDFTFSGGKLHLETICSKDSYADSLRLENLKTKLLNSPFIVDRLLNKDATFTMLIAQMEVMDDFDLKRDAIIATVKKYTENILGTDKVVYGGVGVVYSELNIISQENFKIFVSVSYLLMFVLMFLLFKRFSVVLLCIAVVMSANLITLGIYGFMGYHINMITMIIPTLIIILGIMDVTHIINEHLLQIKKENDDAKALTVTSLNSVLKPCLYTSLTTAVGFSALLFTPMPALREFGAFTAIGILLAFVSTYIFAPVVLLRIKVNKSDKFYTKWLLPGLIKLSNSVHQNTFMYAAISCVIIIVMVYGMCLINVDTYTLSYFPDDHKVLKDNKKLEQIWGGYFPIEFHVAPLDSSKDLVETEGVFAAMDNFVREVTEMKEINNGFSIYNIMQRAFYFSHGINWQNALESKQEIKRFFHTAERADSTVLKSFITEDRKLARLTVFTNLVSSNKLNDIVNELENKAENIFAGKAKINTTAYIPLYTKIVDYVLKAQFQSFILAVFLVFLLMVLLFKKLKFALIAVFLNSFPVVVMFGLMGLLRINLDMATSIIAAVIFGFTIDDTIHFTVNYIQNRNNRLNTYSAIQKTYNKVGSAIVISSIILFVGYLVLVVASVRTIMYFGVLTSIAIMAALYGQLIIYPILLKIFDKDEAK